MGILDTSKPVSISELNKMQKVLSHRGPDDNGLHISSMSNVEGSLLNNIGVAFDRLSIRDLSQNGHQPMFSTDNQVMIAFNGEIYNSEELRPFLIHNGCTFRGSSDTEVLINLYQKVGVDRMLEMIDGMFAICLVDFRQRIVYLIRDKIGEKPLYVYQKNNLLMFASEYKAFYASDRFKAEIDNSAVDEYFMFRYVSCEQTFLKGVRNIEPGTYLKIQETSLQSIHYWNIPLKSINQESFDEIKSEFEKLIEKSVRRRLLSDRPIGLQLSGGVDSSYLCHLVKEKTHRKLNTYCITFDNKSFSEEKYIDYVNEKLWGGGICKKIHILN